MPFTMDTHEQLLHDVRELAQRCGFDVQVNPASGYVHLLDTTGNHQRDRSLSYSYGYESLQVALKQHRWDVNHCWQPKETTP